MRLTSFLLFVLFCFTLTAQNVTLDYYLPDDVTYDPNIPKPSEIIGHEVGEWHVTHDKLMFYMKQLAASSDRITLENRGETFEGRPILLLTITTPENHQNIETIRQQHIGLSEGNTVLNTSEMPIIVYQGFSIHGNEASGSNASLAYAYY